LRSFASVLILLGILLLPVQGGTVPWLDSSMGLLQGELTARYGPLQRLRVQRGLAQTARFWRAGDGGAGEFEAFVRDHFAEPAARDALFERMARVMASLDIHLAEIARDARSGPRPAPALDAILAGYAPGAHVVEDFFTDKAAFAVLLNFPLTTLEERLRDGASWTPRQWAEVWLAERFARRVPARALQAEAEAAAGRRAGGGCQTLLGTFQAARELDPYSPLAPTRIARSFNQERQLPEARVRAMLEAVCGSPLAARTARLLRARLGRELVPSDLHQRFRAEAGFQAADPGSHAPDAPGRAFTEALAMLSRNREPPGESRALAALDGFWTTFANAGAALLDLGVWHWMYEHPGSGVEELRAALAAGAGALWDRIYAPLLGRNGGQLLAEDSRLTAGNLDLPDLPLSGLIAFQLERAAGPPEVRAANLERWARLGRLTPDLWMERATGGPLGPEALLEAAAAALDALQASSSAAIRLAGDGNASSP